MRRTLVQAEITQADRSKIYCSGLWLLDSHRKWLNCHCLHRKNSLSFTTTLSFPCEGDGWFLLQLTHSGVDKRSQAFHLLSSLIETVLHLTRLYRLYRSVGKSSCLSLHLFALHPVDDGLLGETCINEEAATIFLCTPAGTRAGGEEGSIIRDRLPVQFCCPLTAQSVSVPESL